MSSLSRLTLLCLSLAFAPYVACRAQPPQQHQPASALPWETAARLHRFPRSLRGRLIAGPQGIEFHPLAGHSLHWPFVQIKTLDLTQHRLLVVSYENRGWHRPGDRAYRFTFARPMPPAVAARLVQLLRKPVINREPSTQGKAFATIPARHRTLAGGTNGTLRFTETGINYITPRGNGGRSWRWSDIETLARPNPYRFTLSGYMETFDFELKQTMSQTLFDRLWDLVYGRGLRLAIRGSGITSGGE